LELYREACVLQDWPYLICSTKRKNKNTYQLFNQISLLCIYLTVKYKRILK
jgi:hypothetical protein